MLMLVLMQMLMVVNAVDLTSVPYDRDHLL